MHSKSDTIIELAKALSVAQGQISNATKNKENPFFKSNYADLSEVLSEIRAAFSANGLSLTQMPFNDDSGNVGVEALLMHSSGEWIASSVQCKPAKADAQALGAVTTYLRRYQAAAIAGIAQEDDDGNSATHSKKSFDDCEHNKGWLDLMKTNPEKLTDIPDLDYRAFIKQKAGI